MIHHDVTAQNTVDTDKRIGKYTKAYARIKQAHRQTITNIYHDAQRMQVILKAPTSKLFVYDDCLCILHLQHERFYDLFYLAKDAASLEHGLQALHKAYAESLQKERPIRCMIAGKDKETNAPCQALCNAAFPFHKKLIRRRILPFTDKDVKLLEHFTDNQPLTMIEFAQGQDLKEIYSQFCEEFDMYGDNIPEIHAIKENIEKGQVLVIRKDGKIAFIHYFYIINAIYYDYFELTHTAYRQETFYFYYLLYRHMYLQERNIKRLYEWRDAANTRLVKMPLVKYADDESIYITFHLYQPQA